MFTDKEHRGPFEFSEEIGNLSLGQESMDNAPRYDESDKDLLLSTSEKEENGGPNTNGTSGYSAPHDYNSSLVPLSSQTQPEPAVTSQTSFAIDDLLGLSMLAAPAPPSLKLNSKAALDPGTFQRKWGQLGVSISQVDSHIVDLISAPPCITPLRYILSFSSLRIVFLRHFSFSYWYIIGVE